MVHSELAIFIKIESKASAGKKADWKVGFTACFLCSNLILIREKGKF